MWKKLKGSRITEILIGMLIGGILVGCGDAIKEVKADSNEYLIYVGSNNVDGDNETRILSYIRPNSNDMVYVIQSSNKTSYKYNIASSDS